MNAIIAAIAPIGILVSAFIATNIDDLALLMLLLASANHKERGAVYWGQVIGLFIVSILAVLMAEGLNFFPTQWLRFLGLIPLFLGLKEGWESFLKQRAQKHNEDTPEQLPRGERTWWQIAAIVLANSGDNIAVYVPVLVPFSSFLRLFSVFLFSFLALIFCIIGLYLARHPLAQRFIMPYSEAVTAFVLISLGTGVLFGIFV